jgi:hypothetical protein
MLWLRQDLCFFQVHPFWSTAASFSATFSASYKLLPPAARRIRHRQIVQEVSLAQVVSQGFSHATRSSSPGMFPACRLGFEVIKVNKQKGLFTAFALATARSRL